MLYTLVLGGNLVAIQRTSGARKRQVGIVNLERVSLLRVSLIAVLSGLLAVHSLAQSQTLPDLSITHLEITQAVQDLDNSVPLVAGRPTVIRIYAETSAAESEGDVFLSLTGVRDGAPLPNSPLVIGPTALPTVSSRSDYSSTINVHLPDDWLNGSVRITVDVDPDNVIAESNEANNFATEDLDFFDVPRLKLTLIPYIYTHTPTGDVYVQPAEDTISDWLIRRFPLSGIDLTIRDPVHFEGNLTEVGEWNRFLDSVADLKSQQGAHHSEVYFGVVSWGSSHLDYWGQPAFAGLGESRVAVGLDQGRVLYVPSLRVLAAHELAHTFGLGHAEDDPDYPYADGSIGQYGVDVLADELYRPEDTHDITCMACPIGFMFDQWVSDYTYIRLFEDQIAVGMTESLYLPLLIR